MGIFYQSVFAIILSLMVMSQMGCSYLGVTDDPYGPVVNCDANLPMNELLRCVEDKYAFMDKVYEPKLIERLKQYGLEDRNHQSRFEENVPYRKVSEFKSLQACGEKCHGDIYGRTFPYDKIYEFEGLNTCGNKCQVDINGKLFPYTMDIYGGREVGIAHGYSIEMINNVNGRLGDFSGLTNPYYFLRSRKIPRKDLVLAETNKRLQFFTVSAEGVRLDGGKDLLGIQVIDFCNKNPEEEGYVRVRGTRYYKQVSEKARVYTGSKNFYPVCYGYVFWVVGNIKEAEKTLALSLDKRVNPTKAYIKLGKDIYEINLKGGEGKK